MCIVDWNVYVCCLNGHRISGSVLNIVCQSFGITLAPISAPLSLAVREPQNEGTLSIEHTFVLYCYRLQKRAGKVGNFVTSSAAPVSYHRKLENSATTCLTHVWLTPWHWMNEWISDWIMMAGGVEMYYYICVASARCYMHNDTESVISLSVRLFSKGKINV